MLANTIPYLRSLYLYWGGPLLFLDALNIPEYAIGYEYIYRCIVCLSLGFSCRLDDEVHDVAYAHI